MKLIKRTPRSEMVAKILWKHSEGLAEALAQALEAPQDAVQTELNTFIYISTNVEFENGDIEWQPVCATDDEAIIIAKFLAYMNADIEPSNQAAALIQQRDRPHDVALAPTPPDVTQKNS